MREQDGATVVNPIALIVLASTDDHVDNIIINPNLGVCTKGRDMLPA